MPNLSKAPSQPARRVAGLVLLVASLGFAGTLAFFHTLLELFR